MKEKAILCVDDELDILDTLYTLLVEEFGEIYEIEKAESAEEAFEVITELAEEGISLVVIISDWLMPGMKGDDFFIQVHKKYPHITKIMLTGQADDKVIKRAEKEAGLVACFRKPWNNRDLMELIKKEIQKYG